MAGTDADVYGVPLFPDPTRCKLPFVDWLSRHIIHSW